MKRFAVLVVLVLIAALPSIAGAAGGDMVAQLQQEQLAELNAARWDPQGWAAEPEHNANLDGIMPLPPLAVNPNLMSSANFKANEVAVTGLGPDHQSLVPPDYLWPNELAISFGYDLAAALGVETNTIEAYYAGADQPILGFLSAVNGPHRPLLMQWPDRLEVGVGRSDLGNNWIFHLAYRDGTGPFLTGTVFDDTNGNEQMDAGEGLPGITVTAGGFGTVTNGGGGFSIEVPPGTYLVEASGTGLVGTPWTKVDVTGYNVGVDFISGLKRPIVRDYQLCNGLEPTILGTSGDDVIYGTPGDDVIQALAGDDLVYAARGNDVVCGGLGDDVLRGGGGKDLLLAGRGDDEVYGGFGNDRLKGQKGVDLLNGNMATDICRTGEDLIACELP